MLPVTRWIVLLVLACPALTLAQTFVQGSTVHAVPIERTAPAAASAQPARPVVQDCIVQGKLEPLAQGGAWLRGTQNWFIPPEVMARQNPRACATGYCKSDQAKCFVDPASQTRVVSYANLVQAWPPESLEGTYTVQTNSGAGRPDQLALQHLSSQRRFQAHGELGRTIKSACPPPARCEMRLTVQQTNSFGHGDVLAVLQANRLADPAAAQTEKVEAPGSCEKIFKVLDACNTANQRGVSCDVVSQTQAPQALRELGLSASNVAVYARLCDSVCVYHPTLWARSRQGGLNACLQEVQR